MPEKGQQGQGFYEIIGSRPEGREGNNNIYQNKKQKTFASAPRFARADMG